ncbi:hypothetical protein BJF77_11095 [Kocuria sp. CNJ-770]|nr:hypothetical protein BJF77_11095 [Kocuria sp. CNJ-770]
MSTNHRQLLTTAGVLACTLLITAVVGAHGGPHMIGASVGLTIRQHVLLVVAQAPLLLRTAL